MMENPNYLGDYKKQKWLAADSVPVSAISNLCSSNEALYYQNNENYISKALPVPYNFSPDFIDFAELDGSSSASDDWLCNNVNVEHFPISNLDEYSVELITPDNEDRKLELYGAVMKNLLFYPRNQFVDSLECTCNNSFENIQNGFTGSEFDSKKDFTINTFCRNTSNLLPNLESQNSNFSSHNKENAFLTFSKTHFERYFPLTKTTGADTFTQSKQQVIEDRLQERIKLVPAEESPCDINYAIDKNITEDVKETSISFTGNIKAEKFDAESDASFQQIPQIQDELLDFNKNGGIDNLNLLTSEEEFSVNLSANDVFRGKF